MKDNATRCFINACLVILVVALGVKVLNYYFTLPAQKIIATMTAEHEARIEIMRKRLVYAKTCIMEEKELDNIYGQAYYNCNRIADQVYPFPDTLKKI
ncbi:hypothetical protein D9M71_467230 [compost metagenome]